MSFASCHFLYEGAIILHLASHGGVPNAQKALRACNSLLDMCEDILLCAMAVCEADSWSVHLSVKTGFGSSNQACQTYGTCSLVIENYLVSNLLLNWN